MVYPCLKEALAHITNTLASDCLLFFELNFIESVLLDLVFWMCFLVVLRRYCVQLYNSPVCNMTTALSILLLVVLHTGGGTYLSDNVTVSQSICFILFSTWQYIRYQR